jgi:HEAT repeat protein
MNLFVCSCTAHLPLATPLRPVGGTIVHSLAFIPPPNGVKITLESLRRYNSILYIQGTRQFIQQKKFMCGIIALEDLLLFSSLRFWKMLVEGLVLMSGAEIGKYLLKGATEVGGGATKDYLKGFFKGKIGAIVDTFKLELKAAMEKAIGEFMTLFVKELQDAGVTDKSINRYYVGSMSIESFIKDPDTIAILGEAFDVSFRRFDSDTIARIQGIWIERYLISGLTFPEDFNWQLLLGKYEFKVKDIRRADEKLRKILDSETLGSIDDGIKTLTSINQEGVDVAKKTNELLQSNAPIPIKFDLDGYRKSLQESYGDLKLGRLGKKDKHNIQLGKIFIEQNVREALPPDPSPDPNSDESERNRRQYLEKSAEPVLNVLRDEKCQRAVLLGDPGSGKSSLLQYLALDWVEDNTKPLPLLIELREYAIDRSGAENFLDFLSRGTMADWNFDRQRLHEHLQNQPSLVMFDGLDEIFDPQLRQSTIEQIAKFATQQYPNAKIVITSRVVGYDPDRLRGVKFQHFTLQELDESQIQAFIDKWYKLAQGEKVEQEQLKQRLKDAIDRSPAIQNLANNPLLLTLMAMLNQQGDLPTRRVELYDRASQILLHNWDFDGKNLKLHPSIETIEADEKQEILGNIAYKMQSEETGLAGNLLDSKGLNQILIGYFKKNAFQEPPEKAKRLIKQLSSRSFILCAYGTDAYGFVHRTFLEYFCARDFVRRFKEEPYPSLEQLRDDIFARHWRDKTWHEVLQLICGLLDPEEAGYLVEFLIMRKVYRANYLNDRNDVTTGAFQHLLLATECWAEVKSPKSGSTAEKLKKQLIREIASQSENSLDCDAAELLLDSIAKYYRTEPETITWLQRVATNDCTDMVVQWAAVNSIGKYYHSSPESLNCLQQIVLNNQNKDVREAAVEWICKYHSSPESLNFLQQIVFKSKDSLVQWAAVKSIAQYYHTLPETLTWLQDIAFNNQDEYVRRLAIESIAQYYHTIPETISCLQQVALEDKDMSVRQAAVKSIGKYYHNDPHKGARQGAVRSIGKYYHTISETINVALNDKDMFVRLKAVRSIGTRYHTVPETINCLQQIALEDKAQDVRLAAVRSIVRYYHTVPETRSCLQQVALEDKDKGVRQAAIESIVQYYHTVPETRSCLQQVALEDKDKGVRQAAIESIVQYYHTVPETISCLQQVALKDKDMFVRQEVVRSIAQYYHAIPETISCLQQVALEDKDMSVRQAAVSSIAQYYHTVPETLNWLQDIALNNQDDAVRRAAVQSIAQYCHTVPEALNWLQDIALNNRDRTTRWVVESIAQYCHTVPEALNWLQDIALNNQDDAVRRAAVQSIAQYCHTEPETLSCLQQIALNAQHKKIELESNGEYDSTLTWLQEWQNIDDSLSDEIEWLMEVVKSIAQYYQTDPESLNWLQDIALNNRDRITRWVVVESIAQYYHMEPETLTWLQNIALNDRDDAIRGLSLDCICKYYRDEPDSLTWLQNIALQDRDEGVRFSVVCSIYTHKIQADWVFKLLCQIASQDPYRGKNEHNPRKIALEAVVENYIDTSGRLCQRPEVIELLRDRSTQEPDEELRIWAEEQLKNIG